MPSRNEPGMKDSVESSAFVMARRVTAAGPPRWVALFDDFSTQRTPFH
jgi:hypothetical protein